MAFNGQGQWRQDSWTGFQSWVGNQQTFFDQRLRLLRYKSALCRRRLTNLLQNLPPNFTQDVQNSSSFAVGSAVDTNGNTLGDDRLPVFQAEWKPQNVTNVGPMVRPAVQVPKTQTGKPTLEIKKFFYRELRGVEYFEHLIQKTRYEIEQIENEIYWLEYGPERISRNIGIVNTQWNDPEYRDNLVATGEITRLSMLEPIRDDVAQKYAEDRILRDSYFNAQGIPMPMNLPNMSGISDIIQQTFLVEDESKALTIDGG